MELDAYLDEREQKGLLRFITCGSVDDGKSTLIGRLLYESGKLFDDQLEALARRLASGSAPRVASSTSRCCSTVSPPSASRGSRSTSPTATSRPSSATSSSPTRPGHEQYTRNMVTGASTADCAVILVDARKGVAHADAPPHLHRRRCSAIRHVAFAVNKMDLVDYREAAFREIEAGCREIAAELGLDE